VVQYQFTAVTIENVKVRGVIEARDERDFRRIMRGDDLVPLKFSIVDEKSQTYRLKSNETAEFCRQLSNMLSSGIPAVRAMEILKERNFHPKLKTIYEKIYRELLKGQAISAAMQLQGRAFPELLINMFASGEASGQLDNVTDRMATHYEKEFKLDGKIKSAMRYPIILAVATVLVVLFIFLVVLPQFFGMLQNYDIPPITRAVMAISAFLQVWWYILPIIVLIIVLLSKYLLTVHSFRAAFDRFKLRLPAVGKLLKVIYTARFARTLSSLYSSGVPIIQALEITGTTINNQYIQDQFPELLKNVRNGEPLSESVRLIDGFDNKLPNTIHIGEESGRLDSMLISTAESFDYEAEMATTALVAYAEPIMIIIMAAVILSVILSVMLPMVTLYASIGV